MNNEIISVTDTSLCFFLIQLRERHSHFCACRPEWWVTSVFEVPSLGELCNSISYWQTRGSNKKKKKIRRIKRSLLAYLRAFPKFFNCLKKGVWEPKTTTKKKPKRKRRVEEKYATPLPMVKYLALKFRFSFYFPYE